jgi:hypothetical protein
LAGPCSGPRPPPPFAGAGAAQAWREWRALAAAGGWLGLRAVPAAAAGRRRAAAFWVPCEQQVRKTVAEAAEGDEGTGEGMGTAAKRQRHGRPVTG